MIVQCPRCHSRYDVSGRAPGTLARCRCSATFELPFRRREAGIIRCPKCAAGIDPGSHRCEFCTTELRLRACPHCFAQMFAGAGHCDQCGCKVVLESQTTIDGEARGRACPRCPDKQLVARLFGELLFDQCASCRGLFVDNPTIEQIVLERLQGGALEILNMARDVAGTPVPPPTYVRCPVCDVVMMRRNFGRRSGVMVDVCRPHGTWFDRHELPRVVEFVASGRLDPAELTDLANMSEESRRAAAGMPTMADVVGKLDMSEWRNESIAARAVIGLLEALASDR